HAPSSAARACRQPSPRGTSRTSSACRRCVESSSSAVRAGAFRCRVCTGPRRRGARRDASPLRCSLSEPHSACEPPTASLDVKLIITPARGTSLCPDWGPGEISRTDQACSNLPAVRPTQGTMGKQLRSLRTWRNQHIQPHRVLAPISELLWCYAELLAAIGREFSDEEWFRAAEHVEAARTWVFAFDNGRALSDARRNLPTS